MIAASAQTDDYPFLWIIYCCGDHCKASFTPVEAFELRYPLATDGGTTTRRSVCLLALQVYYLNLGHGNGGPGAASGGGAPEAMVCVSSALSLISHRPSCLAFDFSCRLLSFGWDSMPLTLRSPPCRQHPNPQSTLMHGFMQGVNRKHNLQLKVNPITTNNNSSTRH